MYYFFIFILCIQVFCLHFWYTLPPLSLSLYTETGVRGNFESPFESWITRPRTSGRADGDVNCWNIAPAFTFCDLLKLKEFKKVSWHVLILFFTERYSLLWWPRTWDQIDQGPKIKPNTPSLLKEQSHETNPDDILLYSDQCLAQLSSEMLPPEQEQIQRPTTGQCAVWVRDFGTLTPKWSIYIKSLSTGVRNSGEEEAARV